MATQYPYEKYYSFEKGKHGGPCGSMFPFFRELAGISALGQDYLEYVPAGFLKCRGQILSADQYPNLARVLGVGPSSIYKKEGTTLSEPDDDGTGGTFQLPDLGSKYIAGNANAGTYSNIDVTNPSSNATTQRAGVGISLEAQSTSVDFAYQGQFKVPGRVLKLVGNIQSKSPPSATDDEDLSIGQFLAHGHNWTGKISKRINFRSDALEYATFKRAYICSKNNQKTCSADMEGGLAHRGISFSETGSDTATKHKHFGSAPQKLSESKTASVAAITMDAGSIVTTVNINVANTFKSDDIAPKFILCEYLIKF
jgi:hypothetical protein